jgi:hypothetical protein
MHGDEEGGAYVGFSTSATHWYERLTPARRKVVDRRLRELASNPERAPFRVTTANQRTVFFAQALIDDGEVWSYRIDFVVDEVMQRRGRLPAIAVMRARTLPYPRR